MNGYEKLWAVFWFCAAAVVVTFMILMFQDCARTDEHKLSCVKAGTAPEECRRLFKHSGTQ